MGSHRCACEQTRAVADGTANWMGQELSLFYRYANSARLRTWANPNCISASGADAEPIQGALGSERSPSIPPTGLNGRNCSARVRTDEAEALLIAPERLANGDFVESVLLPIAERIGLLVVDEVHCISDWGHDFRPDYRRLINVLQRMTDNVPILGTTATADNRVVADIQAQLGEIGIQRGSLMRHTLALQTMRATDTSSPLGLARRARPRTSRHRDYLHCLPELSNPSPPCPYHLPAWPERPNPSLAFRRPSLPLSPEGQRPNSHPVRRPARLWPGR